jgi:hypothetical protein
MFIVQPPVSFLAPRSEIQSSVRPSKMFDYILKKKSFAKIKNINQNAIAKNNYENIFDWLMPTEELNQLKRAALSNMTFNILNGTI